MSALDGVTVHCSRLCCRGAESLWTKLCRSVHREKNMSTRIADSGGRQRNRCIHRMDVATVVCVFWSCSMRCACLKRRAPRHRWKDKGAPWTTQGPGVRHWMPGCADGGSAGLEFWGPRDELRRRRRSISWTNSSFSFWTFFGTSWWSFSMLLPPLYVFFSSGRGRALTSSFRS